MLNKLSAMPMSMLLHDKCPSGSGANFLLIFIPNATSGNKLASLDFHIFYNFRDAFLEELGAHSDLLWESCK
jgi:hypothetical protein